MSPERSKTALNKQIVEEAAEWFVELNEGEADIATRHQFDAWLRVSPEHVRAYLELLPFWEEGAQLDTEANGDPQALIAWTRADSNVVPLSAAVRPEQDPHPFRSHVRVGVRARRFAVAASVALLCIAVALGAWLLVGRGSTYETGIGEQRLIALADGSRVELNSRSRIRVRFSEGERSIDLVDGQALFNVAKDTARPFVVRSDGTRVRAVGTQFDVYKKATGTIVTVLEGRVAVGPDRRSSSDGAETVDGDNINVSPMPVDTSDRATIHLSAGQQVIVTRAAVSRPTRTNVAAATAWTQQRLVFSRTPLTEVAEEFNRYNDRHLIIKNGGLTSFNVSGTFSSTDPASLVRFLRAQPGVNVNETSTEILISGE